jgi:hypothetical protein
MSWEIVSPTQCLLFDPEVKITNPAAARHSQISSFYGSKSVCLSVGIRTIQWTDGVKYRLFLQAFHDSSRAFVKLQHRMFGDSKWPYRIRRATSKCMRSSTEGAEGDHETPVREAIYWIAFETGTSKIGLNSVKYCISRKFERAVKERVIGSPVTITYLHFLCWHPANYLQLLWFYPENIHNFCDSTRHLSTISVIIPGNYLQLWLYPANVYNLCDSTRQLITTSVIIPGKYLQLWLYPANVYNFCDSTRQLLQLLWLYPAIIYNCDYTRKMFTTFVIILGKYSELLW